MRNVDLNELLKEVINEARDADIPVPFNIDKEVIINKKARISYENSCTGQRFARQGFTS